MMLIFYYFRDIHIFEVRHDINTILSSATFLFNLQPSNIESYVWAGWTIGVEMLFYLVFPFIYKYSKDVSSALCLFLISVLLSWAWLFWLKNFSINLNYVNPELLSKTQRFSFLAHLPTFALGIVTYHIFNFLHKTLSKKSQKKLGLLLLVFFAYFYTALLCGEIKGLWNNFIWQAIAYSILIIGLGLFPLKVLVNKYTTQIGKISYSLYLLHPTIVWAMGHVLFDDIYQASPSTSFAFFVCCALTIIALTPSSYVAYRYIERSGIKIGNMIINRISIGITNEKLPSQ